MTTPPQAEPAWNLFAEWINRQRHRPPHAVSCQVAQQIGWLLTEGIHPAHVQAALREFDRRRVHPATLPSLVYNAQRCHPNPDITDTQPGQATS